MKKIIALMASASLIATSVVPGIAIASKETRNPEVFINNTVVEFPDQKAYITDEGRTLVPARGVFEALGCAVEWDSELYEVTVKNEEFKKEIKLKIDNNLMKVVTDGTEESKILDVPAQLMNNRTMIPLRAVSEAIGCGVDWDGEEYRIDITSAKKEYAPLTSKIYLKAPTGTVKVGDEITVPVMLSDVKGLKGAMFRIKWDPKQLQMRGTNVSASSGFDGYSGRPDLFKAFCDINQSELATGVLTVAGGADAVVSTEGKDYLLGNLHFKVLSGAAGKTVALEFDTTELKTSGNNGETNLKFASADGVSFSAKEKASSGGGGGGGSSRPSSGGSSSGGSSSGGSSSGGSSSGDTTKPEEPKPEEPKPEEPTPDEPEIEEPEETEPQVVYSFGEISGKAGEVVEVEITVTSLAQANTLSVGLIELSGSGEILEFEFSEEVKALMDSTFSHYDPEYQAVMVLLNEIQTFNGVLGTLKIQLSDDASGEIVITAKAPYTTVNGTTAVPSGVGDGKITIE